MADQIDILKLFSNPNAELEKKVTFIKDHTLIDCHQTFKCKVNSLSDATGIIEVDILEQKNLNDMKELIQPAPLYYVKNIYPEYLYLQDNAMYQSTANAQTSKDIIIYQPYKLMISKKIFQKMASSENHLKIKIIYKNSKNRFNSYDNICLDMNFKNKEFIELIFPQVCSEETNFLIEGKKIAEFGEIIIIAIQKFTDPTQLNYKSFIFSNFSSAIHYVGKNGFIANTRTGKQRGMENLSEINEKKFDPFIDDYLIDINKLRTTDPYYILLFFTFLLQNRYSKEAKVNDNKILMLPKNLSKLLIQTSILTRQLPILTYNKVIAEGINNVVHVNELATRFVNKLRDLERNHTKFTYLLICSSKPLENIQEIDNAFLPIEFSYKEIIKSISTDSNSALGEFLFNVGCLPDEIRFFNSPEYNLTLSNYIVASLFPTHLIYLLHKLINYFFKNMFENLNTDISYFTNNKLNKHNNKKGLDNIYLIPEHKNFILNINYKSIDSKLKYQILDYGIRLLICNIKLAFTLKNSNIDELFPAKDVEIIYLNLLHYINLVLDSSKRTYYISLLKELLRLPQDLCSLN